MLSFQTQLNRFYLGKICASIGIFFSFFSFFCWHRCATFWTFSKGKRRSSSMLGPQVYLPLYFWGILGGVARAAIFQKERVTANKKTQIIYLFSVSSSRKQFQSENIDILLLSFTRNKSYVFALWWIENRFRVCIFWTGGGLSGTSGSFSRSLSSQFAFDVFHLKQHEIRHYR